MRTWGTGPRHFLGLHGWAADHSTFEHLLAYMPTDCTLHAPDLPGYGQSARMPAWSLEALEQSLEEIVLGLPVDQDLTILGSCSGAILALCGLHKRVEQLGITRMFLLEPFAFLPAYLSVFTAPVLGPVAYWSAFCNPVGRAITDANIKRQDIADHHGTSASFDMVDPWVPYHYLQLMKAQGAPQQFAQMPCAVDLVHGEHTFDAIVDGIPIWQSTWPHARTHRLEGVGHMLIQEAPEALARVLFAPKGEHTVP